MLEYSHQSTSEDEHQEEVKSVETEFIEGQREHESCTIRFALGTSCTIRFVALGNAEVANDKGTFYKLGTFMLIYLFFNIIHLC